MPRGFCLLEVLIAAFILAFGLLSISALENAAIIRNHDDYLRSIAISRLRNICERFYASGDVNDIAIWDKENNSILPQASSTHRCEKYESCTINLYWQGRTNAKLNQLSTVAVKGK